VIKIDDSDPEFYEFTFEVIVGDHAGRTIRMRNYLSKESLWALRRTIEALGFKVPDSAFKLDLDTLLNRKCVITCKMKPSKDGSTEYLNIVGMAPASTWVGNAWIHARPRTSAVMKKDKGRGAIGIPDVSETPGA
jgi:hypothetical protein